MPVFESQKFITGSRQMLLTLEDFFLYDRKNPDEVKPGRLAQVLDPVFAKK
jgi:hypothetical protein